MGKGDVHILIDSILKGTKEEYKYFFRSHESSHEFSISHFRCSAIVDSLRQAVHLFLHLGALSTWLIWSTSLRQEASRAAASVRLTVLNIAAHIT